MRRIHSTSVNAEIRKSLLSYIGDLDPHSEGKLPSEISMAETLGVSRIALREVLKELQQEGVIISIHGKGTFINRDLQKMKVRLTPAVEFEQAIRNSGYTATVSLVEVSTMLPSESVRKSLHMKQSETVIIARKVFFADGHPVVFCEDIFPSALSGPGPLIEKELEISTFEYLLQKSHVIVVHDIAELLACTTGDLTGFSPHYFPSPKPLLLIKSVYYTAKHKPVMHVNAYMDTDFIKLSILRRQDVYSDND